MLLFVKNSSSALVAEVGTAPMYALASLAVLPEVLAVQTIPPREDPGV